MKRNDHGPAGGFLSFTCSRAGLPVRGRSRRAPGSLPIPRRPEAVGSRRDFERGDDRRLVGVWNRSVFEVEPERLFSGSRAPPRPSPLTRDRDLEAAGDVPRQLMRDRCGESHGEKLEYTVSATGSGLLRCKCVNYQDADGLRARECNGLASRSGLFRSALERRLYRVQASHDSGMNPVDQRPVVALQHVDARPHDARDLKHGDARCLRVRGERRA